LIGLTGDFKVLAILVDILVEEVVDFGVFDYVRNFQHIESLHKIFLRDPEDTIVATLMVGRFFEIGSPFRIIVIVGSFVLLFAPGVAHLDQINPFIGKIAEDCVSM